MITNSKNVVVKDGINDILGGLATTNFDEDPEDMLTKYKTQLNQLEARINLLQGEHDQMELESKECAIKLEEVGTLLEQSTNEMTIIAEKIVKYQKRLLELNAIADKNEPLVEKLDRRIIECVERKNQVKETLDVLKQRRKKVYVIWNSINESLAKK
jgi:chromosome segregation ATPase